MTPCTCPASGFCPLHRFTTTRREWQLCRTDQRWFDLFSRGDSPQHAREQISPPVPTGSQGFGDTVANLLARVGIKGWSGCRCAARRAWLNRMFPYRQQKSV